MPGRRWQTDRSQSFPTGETVKLGARPLETGVSGQVRQTVAEAASDGHLSSRLLEQHQGPRLQGAMAS